MRRLSVRISAVWVLWLVWTVLDVLAIKFAPGTWIAPKSPESAVAGIFGTLWFAAVLSAEAAIERRWGV